MKTLTTLMTACLLAVFSAPDAEAGPGERKARPGARGQGAAGKAGRRHRAKRMFKKLDQNQDGSLSQDEVPERLWKRLGKADADESGSVTPDELKAARAARREKIKALDTNQDGELGQDEVSAEVWEKISAADKDGNGAVSKAEGKRARAKRRRGARAKRRFEKADKNGDGQISQDEVSEEIWERLSKADADGDGNVTKEELKAARKGRAGKRGGQGGRRGGPRGR